MSLVTLLCDYSHCFLIKILALFLNGGAEMATRTIIGQINYYKGDGEKDELKYIIT